MRLIGLAITLAFSLTLTPLTGEGQQAGKPYPSGFSAAVRPTKTRHTSRRSGKAYVTWGGS